MSTLACSTAICQPGLCPGKQTCTVIEGEAVCSCKCSGSGCNNAGTVCGSNGQSYDSQAALTLAACRSGKDIDLDYYGECQGEYYCNRCIAQTLMIKPVLSISTLTEKKYGLVTQLLPEDNTWMIRIVTKHCHESKNR